MRVKNLINVALLLIPLALGGIAQANDQTIPWGKTPAVWNPIILPPSAKI